MILAPLEKIHIEPLGAESLGVRSFCFYVKTPDLASPSNRDPLLGHSAYMSQLQYAPLYTKWKETISKIDVALNSLTIKEEVSIIDQYLTLIKERNSQEASKEEIEKDLP